MYRCFDPNDFTRSIDLFLPTAMGRVLPGNTMVLRKGSRGNVFFRRDSSISVLPSIKSVPINEMISPWESSLLNVCLLNGFIFIFFVFQTEKWLLLFCRVSNNYSKSVPKEQKLLRMIICSRTG